MDCWKRAIFCLAYSITQADPQFNISLRNLIREELHRGEGRRSRTSRLALTTVRVQLTVRPLPLAGPLLASRCLFLVTALPRLPSAARLRSRPPRVWWSLLWLLSLPSRHLDRLLHSRLRRFVHGYRWFLHRLLSRRTRVRLRLCLVWVLNLASRCSAPVLPSLHRCLLRYALPRPMFVCPSTLVVWRLLPLLVRCLLQLFVKLGSNILPRVA